MTTRDTLRKEIARIQAELKIKHVNTRDLNSINDCHNTIIEIIKTYDAADYLKERISQLQKMCDNYMIELSNKKQLLEHAERKVELLESVEKKLHNQLEIEKNRILAISNRNEKLEDLVDILQYSKKDHFISINTLIDKVLG